MATKRRMSKAERRALKKKSKPQSTAVSGEKRKAAGSNSVRQQEKSKHVRKKVKRAPPAPKAISEYATQVIASLRSGSGRGGTVSDRLNPAHRCFDKELKDRWTSLPKRDRSAITKCDSSLIERRGEAVAAIRYPLSGS